MAILKQLAGVVAEQNALEEFQRQRGIWLHEGEVARLDAYRRITEILSHALDRLELRTTF